MTPEGKVKKAVRELLNRYKGLYQYWPVPSGYGRATVDVLGCYQGHFFAIEVKAPGKLPTARQRTVLDEIVQSGGTIFVIDDVRSYTLASLEECLNRWGTIGLRA